LIIGQEVLVLPITFSKYLSHHIRLKISYVANKQLAGRELQPFKRSTVMPFLPGLQTWNV